MRLFLLLVSSLALLPSCLVVDRGPLDRLRARADGGTEEDTGMVVEDVPTPPVDTGPVVGPSDQCGDPDAEVLIGTSTRDVDTTTLNPDFTILGMATGGNDAFFQFHAVSGEFWHFHLAALTADRDPVLYIVQASGGVCSSSTPFVRNACSGREGDEHFAFIAPSTGDYFVAVDDGMTGGARYRLQVVRPVCGNSTAEHGEPCDEGPTGGATCTDMCRIILADAAGTGTVGTPIGRHNDTAAEAMEVRLPATDTLDITGIIATGDCYPDVFAIDIAAGQTLSVTARDPSSGNACDSAADAEYSLELRNGADARIGGTVDGMGCPVITSSPAEGRYFVWLRATGDGSRPAPYDLRFTVTP